MSKFIYIICEWIASGYTIGHIATQRKINEWKNVQAFAEEEEALKFLESIKREDDPYKYCIEKIPVL